FCALASAPKTNLKTKGLGTQNTVPPAPPPAPPRPDSFPGNMPVSSWFPPQSELRMVVWQNTRRRHVKLKGSQIGILFYLFDELISESSCIRLAIDGKLPRRLVLRRNPHLGRGKVFEKMRQKFDRVITCIDPRSQCLPVRFRGADELRPGSIVCNARVNPSHLKSEQPQIREQKKEKRNVSATYPHEPLLPFCLPDYL